MYKAITIASILVLAFGHTYSQEKYICRNGHAWFHSEAPMETIEAHNHQVSSVFDPAEGKMVFQVLMKSFQFEKALMQEHFNENYVESDKYPKATFSGIIENFGQVDLTNTEIQEIAVTGSLTIHGVTNDVSATGTLQMLDGKLVAKSGFNIVLTNYKIKIPKVVKENISKTIDIYIDVSYEMK